MNSLSIENLSGSQLNIGTDGASSRNTSEARTGRISDPDVAGSQSGSSVGFSDVLKNYYFSSQSVPS